jgi:hypothetical protein
VAWLRIDDRVRTHPKIAQAGPSAAWLWFCGICYCREHLTDGFIPKAVLPGLALGLTQAEKHAKSLIAVNLWHPTEGGYLVHDFLDWNPSRAEVESQRTDERERKRRERGHDAVSGRTDAGQPPVSESIPDGLHPVSSHARAGAPARALKTGSGSGDPEKEKRENSPPQQQPFRRPLVERQRPDRMNPGGVVPMLDRQFTEFVSRVSPEYPDRTAAYAAVLAWMHQVDDLTTAKGRAVGGDPFKWWQARFDEWKHPAPVNGKGRPEPPPEYRMAEEPCRHDPPCTNAEMHRIALQLKRPEVVL